MAANAAGRGGARSTSNPRQQEKSQPIIPVSPSETAPAGFETFFSAQKNSIIDPFHAIMLPLHWSLIRGGLRLRRNESCPVPVAFSMNDLTESLPENWTSKIMRKQEEGSNDTLRYLVLRYWEHSNSSYHYEAKIVEVVTNHAVVMILFRAQNACGTDGTVQAANRVDMNSTSSGRNASASNFILQEYLQMQLFAGTHRENSTLLASSKNWFEIYKNLQHLEKLVYEQLLEPVGLGLSRNREPTPYESRLPQQQQQNQQPQQQQQQVPPPQYQMPPPANPYPTGGIGGPLYNPPGVPAGGGGLGRSDLDPLGGFGAGNVADPRGFRQPPTIFPFGGGMAGIGPVGPLGGLTPPFVPPGARFDPFGPGNPAPNPRPNLPPGAGGTQGGWGVPNPDAEQPPPGFDDMFM